MQHVKDLEQTLPTINVLSSSSDAQGGTKDDAILNERSNERLFLAAIVDSSQDSIISIDFEGVITTWNRAAEQLYGYRRDEALGRALGDLAFPQDLAEVLANAERIKHNHEVAIFESVRFHKDGHAMHLEVSMSPVRDESGQVVGVSTIARDVTRRKQLEEEVQKAQEALQLSHDLLERRVEQRTQQLIEEVDQRRALQEQRTQLLERLMQVQEAERGRVSRELHDNLGQHLTAVLLGIQALQNQRDAIPAEQRFRWDQGLSRLYEMVNELTGVSHRLAWELRPAVLDNIGLEAALEQYVALWAKKGIAADFVSRLAQNELARNESGLSSEAETALYRVTQEALTNVQRHSGASQVSVILERKREVVAVIIEDNGHGFDVEEAARRNRLGVLGMRERMELVGGTLEIESEVGSGTAVYARVRVGEV